jgi:OOP family OmpA-OmpF porin
MNPLRVLRLLPVLILLLLMGGHLLAQDVPGSKDHPLITRYPGTVISWYNVANFAPYYIATGPEIGYRTIQDWVEVAGKVTRIYYTLKGERTMTEVYLNYLNAVKRAGFSMLCQGVYQDRNVNKEVGGGSWMGVQYGRNSFPTNSKIVLLQGSSNTGGHCFFASKLQQAGSTVYVAVGGHQYTDSEVVFLVDIIEVDALEDGLVTADAKAMGESLDRSGKVALYGIYFDVDKSDVLPASAAELAEVAKLLKARPDLQLYVVGHTDMQGSLEHNRVLSEARAKAVVAVLTQQHGIAAPRLLGMGVGPLAPLASNLNEVGRALNRRVELVLR